MSSIETTVNKIILGDNLEILRGMPNILEIINE
jgi:hypothetical protein